MEQNQTHRVAPPVMKPFIGASVWYTPSAPEKNTRAPFGMSVAYQQPLHAVIIAIHGDRMVNLLVTDVAGKQFPVLSATLRQPGDKLAKDVGGMVAGRYAEWPFTDYDQWAPADEEAMPSVSEDPART